MSSFGKYRLIAELGHGGMADVFLAAFKGSLGDQSFNKLLVIKKLRKSLAADPEFIAMLLDEGRLAARLNHPNVIQTYEIGELDGQFFIAMEFLEGQPLNRVLSRGKSKGKPLPPEMAYTIFADVLAGLHYAHELADFDGSPIGVVHRDVSPHNVFVSYAGQIKVVDFGIAKAVGRSTETNDGTIKGKISYMAPEQVKSSKSVDRRTDVFAVGIMLWEMATGKRMWEGLQDVEIVQRLVSGEYPQHPREVNPEVSEELDAICAKALAFDPAARYLTAADFQGALETYLTSTRAQARAREIGIYVSDLFADKREELKNVVEQQLKKIKESPESTLENLPPVSATGSHTSQNGSLSPPEVPGQTVVISAPKRGPNVGMIVAGVAAVAGVGFLIVKMGSKDPPTGPGTSGSTTSATALLVDSGSVTPPAPQTVQLILKATPTEARFKIDNGPPLENPYVGKFPKDDSPHNLHISAPGYKSIDTPLSFARESEKTFSLDKLPAAAPTHSAKPFGTSIDDLTRPGKGGRPLKPIDDLTK